MDWFYALNDQQNGPVSDVQLDDLLAIGKINQNTLVWHDGMANWQPLSVVRGGGPPSVPNVSSGICAECGRSFAPENLIQLNRTWVCAQCKPILLQKLQEGAALPKGAGSMWRTGSQLVTISETEFPDRCVKCNAPANGYRLKRILYWQHPAYYLLLLVNLLVLLIVVLAVRKKAILHVGLCEKHQAVRRQTIMIGWIGALGGLALCFGAFVFHGGTAVLFVVTGIFVFLGFLIYAGLRAPMVSPAKITKENVWLKGVHRDFLNTLPEWTGR